MPFVNTYCILFSVAVGVSSQVDKVKYDGAQVWQTVLRGSDDVLFIKKLVDNQDISIWNLSPTRAEFLVRGRHRVKVYRQLMARHLTHTVLIMDVQGKIDLQLAAPPLWNENTLRTGHRLSWKKYPTLHIIEEYFNYLAEDYSSICKLQTIGTTAENRTIKMINITNGNPNNKIILITAGSHAREWVAVTSALYIINNIVTKYDKQPSYIKDKNWLIIPVVNPDGYAYTHTVDRLWRKNRRKFMYCNGVDINRNFETDWGIPGIAENNECKLSYSGPFPFSEAETIALRDLVSSSIPKLTALVDLHSYGKLIMFPWSARNQTSPDLQVHKELAGRMCKSIQKMTKENYTFGEAYNVVYPASGTFLDWVYTKGVVHSYVIETRDGGELGFLIPPQDIEEIGKELYVALRTLSKFINAAEKVAGEHHQSWF